MTAFRQPQPWGKTAAFVDAVAAKMGKPFVDAWLSPRTCRFSDTTVFTTGLGAQKLATAVSHIADAHGVTVKHCPDVTAGFWAQQDARA